MKKTIIAVLLLMACNQPQQNFPQTPIDTMVEVSGTYTMNDLRADPSFDKTMVFSDSAQWYARRNDIDNFLRCLDSFKKYEILFMKRTDELLLHVNKELNTKSDVYIYNAKNFYNANHAAVTIYNLNRTSRSMRR